MRADVAENASCGEDAGAAAATAVTGVVTERAAVSATAPGTAQIPAKNTLPVTDTAQSTADNPGSCPEGNPTHYSGPHRPVVIIPARNEAASVGAVIDEISACCDFPIVLVDDASTDGTAAVALSRKITVIPLTCRLGAWGATQAGIRYGEACGYDLVITMDADGQHDPRFISMLLDALLETDADVCIGAWPERGSIMRQFAWRLLRGTSGIRIEDLTSGFRAYNHRAINVLADWRATYLDFQDVGVLSLLISQGLHIVDTRTAMRPRSHGHSRVFNSWLIVTYYMCHTMLLGLTKRPIRRYRGKRVLQEAA